MKKSMPRLVSMVLLLGVLQIIGCGGQVQYVSPAAQEESKTYRGMYGPFGLEPGPSATTSGDE